MKINAETIVAMKIKEETIAGQKTNAETTDVIPATIAINKDVFKEKDSEDIRTSIETDKIDMKDVSGNFVSKDV
jgi:hypothetical protein